MATQRHRSPDKLQVNHKAKCPRCGKLYTKNGYYTGSSIWYAYCEKCSHIKKTDNEYSFYKVYLK